jgi:hypothetical protein
MAEAGVIHTSRVIHSYGRCDHEPGTFAARLFSMTRRTSVNWAAIAELGTDGVLTRAQLLAAGVTSATIARSLQPGGRCRRLLPGVLLLNHGEPTRRQLVMASLLYAGPRSVLTGLEAARWHGIRRLPDDGQIHVLVPHGCQVSSRDFLRVERTRRPPSVECITGIPVASAARSVVDAVRRLQRPDQIRAMVADTVQRGICCVDSLAEEVAHWGVPGVAAPRRVLAEIGDGVRSAAEAWARALIRRSRLVPPPAWNIAVHSNTGRRLAVVDAWWDDAGLAWEIDSKEFHLGPDDYDATMRRHSALAASGVLVVHTVPGRLRNDAAAVLDEVERAYIEAKRRPRPDVTASPWRP